MINQIHSLVKGIDSTTMAAHDKLNTIHDMLGEQNSILKLITISLVVIGVLLAIIAWT